MSRLGARPAGGDRTVDRRRPADSRALVRERRAASARWRPTRLSAPSTSISSPGSAYVLLHHVMGEAGGARGVWGYIQGGMGGLWRRRWSGRACELGVEIRRESPVDADSDDTESGRRRGAVESGKQLKAAVVASSVDPHLTFERFLDPADLPSDFLSAVSADRLFVGVGEDQSCALRAAAIHRRAVQRRRAAPSWHDAHRPVDGLPRTGL